MVSHILLAGDCDPTISVGGILPVSYTHLAFNNAVLNMSIISQIYIVQNHRVLDHTVISYKYVFKKDGILHRTINNTSAGNQAVLHLCSRIVFCRRQIINLCLNCRFLFEEDVYKRQLYKWR